MPGLRPPTGALQAIGRELVIARPRPEPGPPSPTLSAMRHAHPGCGTRTRDAARGPGMRHADRWTGQRIRDPARVSEDRGGPAARTLSRRTQPRPLPHRLMRPDAAPSAGRGPARRANRAARTSGTILPLNGFRPVDLHARGPAGPCSGRGAVLPSCGVNGRCPYTGCSCSPASAGAAGRRQTLHRNTGTMQRAPSDMSKGWVMERSPKVATQSNTPESLTSTRSSWWV